MLMEDNMSNLNHLSKVNFVWFKPNAENANVFELPVVSNDKYDGVYRKTSPTREQALIDVREDGNAQVAINEKWLLCKVKLVNTFVTSREIRGGVIKKAEKEVTVAPTGERKKRTYVRRAKKGAGDAINNGATPATA